MSKEFLTGLEKYELTKGFVEDLDIVDINRGGKPDILYCNVEVGSISIENNIMNICIFTNIIPFSEYLKEPNFFLGLWTKLYCFAENTACKRINIIGGKNYLGSFISPYDWKVFFSSFAINDDIEITINNEIVITY